MHQSYFNKKVNIYCNDIIIAVEMMDSDQKGRYSQIRLGGDGDDGELE